MKCRIASIVNLVFPRGTLFSGLALKDWRVR